MDGKMTTKEAAETLLCLYDAVDDEGVIDLGTCYKGIKEHTKEALYMAVEALEDKHKDRKKAKRFKRKYLKLKSNISKAKQAIREYLLKNDFGSGYINDIAYIIDRHVDSE